MTRSSPHDSRVSIRGDNRAVSEVIGFILLFGLLIAGASIIQTYGIPAQNERVEFDHNLRVQEDMVRLSDGVETSGLTGAPVSATVEAGTDYPNRLFFFNPTPPSGALRTGDPLNITITNATASGEVGDYWDGLEKTFTTRPITYTANYNVYRSAPTTIVEHGVVYNDNPNGQATMLKRGSFIRGDRISLVTVDGTFNRGTSQSISVDAVPVSAPSRSVTLTSLTPTDDISLTIETSLSADDWKDILAEEMDTGNVVDVVPGPTAGTVTVELDPSVSYELRMARVGLESGYDESESSPAYMIPVGSATQTVPEGSTTEITFEVRDKFNNPVSNQMVTVGTQDTDSSFAPETVKTDTDGRVTITYTAPTFSDTTTMTDRLKATFNPPLNTGLVDEEPQNAAVSFTVINSDSSGVQVQTGAGQGGESDWSSTDTTHTFTQANGKWKSIDSIGGILLSDGVMATKAECTGERNCNFVDRLSLDFAIEDSTGEQYDVSVRIRDADQSGTIGRNGNNDKDDLRFVNIYDSGKLKFAGVLTSSDAESIVFNDDDPVNILESSNYESIDSTSDINLFNSFEDAEWFTGTTEGRVTVEIKESEE